MRRGTILHVDGLSVAAVDDMSAPSPMIVKTQTGYPALKLGEHWLEDPEDPVAASHIFVQPAQLASADRVVLFGAGLGYRPLRLRQLGVAELVLFEPNQDVLEVAQELLPEAFEQASCFTDLTGLLNHLTSTGSADERTVLLSPRPYQAAYPEAHDAVVEMLRDAQGFRRMRDNAHQGRFDGVLEAALGNLGRVGTIVEATTVDKPLAGCPAFIVAAGPSLDKNIALLPEAAKRGCIFTVNTAAAPVSAHSEIDVLVSIEAIRVADRFDALADKIKVLALDLSAHASSFEVPGPVPTFFAGRHEAFASLHEELGLRPVSYGASVATAGFALAHQWGANPIVLVGQDLAYSGLRAYATGTGREGWKVRLHDDVIHIDYDEATLKRFEDHGLQRPTKGQPRVEVRAWGGDGTESATYDMVLFRRWFEGAARSLTGKVRCINATEGGAHIEGFAEQTLQATIDELPTREHTLVDAIQAAPRHGELHFKAARKSLRRKARAIVEAKTPKKKRRALRDAAFVVELAKATHRSSEECAHLILSWLSA